MRRKAAAFNGWHEPDESRGSSPESVSGSGCNSPGRLGLGVQFPGATHLVITSKSKELLEGEIKSLVEQFLRERGLELSPTKTVITHVEHGFDFLGQNVRRYPNGKLLIKPSKKNVGTFLKGIRGIINDARGSLLPL